MESDNVVHALSQYISDRKSFEADKTVHDLADAVERSSGSTTTTIIVYLGADQQHNNNNNNAFVFRRGFSR
jgi:hypothetical protein